MKTERYYLNNYGESVKNEKQERYYKRIEQMLKKDIFKCYFLTFTFSNKTLEKTTQKTRLRYIKAFLNKQASEYVLNIDYGKKNEREHYHAFILSRYKVIVFSDYKNGYIKAEKAHDTLQKIHTKRTAPSAENLTKHAFKETTKGAKIIYSRDAKPKRAFTMKANAKLKAYQESEIGKQNKADYKEYKERFKREKEQAENQYKELDYIFDIE